MASTIGIKIANGEFYSIIEENSTVKKRLILTTVHDKQRSVQIDLYRSFARTMADAQYIGSLVVENIKPKPKGEPSIELVISSSKNGNITADAIDLDTSAGGEHQVLNVSLKSLDEDTREYEIPDFELEQHEGPPSALYSGSSSAAASNSDDEEKKKFPWIVLIIIGIALILVMAALWFFFLGGRDIVFGSKDRPRVERPASPPPAKPAPPAQPAPPPQQKPASPPPVIQAPSAPKAAAQPASRQRPPAPVSSYKVPATIPKEGAPYRIRWGDTLWDISAAFYRDPWLYPRIVRFNNIRNPDLIISGTTIRVPPKN
jgi:flagellar basal body-associated protein FliL